MKQAAQLSTMGGMPIPERIPMARDDYHLDRIGRDRDGRQFMAFVAASLPKGPPWPSDLQRHVRWYAVLHRFDADGRHLETRAWCGGTRADGDAPAMEHARQKLEEWLTEFAPVRLCDIAVRPFRTEIDGRTFGLIPGDREDDGIELVPGDLAFYEPWDGTYGT